MKRIFTFGLMLASALALTNCTEELVDTTVPTDQVVEEQVTGVPFQIQATLGVDTKTAGDFVGGKLKTKWKENDKINVLFAEVQNGAVGELKDAGLFTVTDTEHGIFEGFLPNEGIEDSKTYNWYFVYDASGATFAKDKTTATITIGSVEQKQSTTTGNNTDTDVEHIGAASNCPMWGRALNLSGSIYPRVQMTHLAALYEVTIRNETKANSISGATAGDILVKDIGMSVSSTGTWISKDGEQQKALVGNFTLNVLNGTIEQDLNNTNYSVKLTITENPLGSISSESGKNEKKYYFVTAPVDIQNDRTTDPNYYEEKADPSVVITLEEYQNSSSKSKYQVATKRQDKFTFTVNGSARTVSAKPEYNQNIQSGNLYKFTLPVHELTHPITTNGFDIESASKRGTDDKYEYKGGFLNLETKTDTDNSHLKCKILTFSDSDNSIKAVINGSEPDLISKLKGGSGQITIEGFAKDMINAMPISFYASRYNDTPTAMTLARLNLWVPTYNDNDYTSLKYRRPIYREMGFLLSNLMSVLSISSDGIPRSALTVFVDENNITFNNIVSNGYFDNQKNVIVMDENATNKAITAELIDSFISKFSAKDGNNQTRTASYYGLYAILNATLNEDGTLTYDAFRDSDGAIVKIKRNGVEIELNASQMAIEADDTANGIYYKMLNTITSKIGSLGSSFASMGESLVHTFITSPMDTKYKLRDMRFKVVLETYPYAEKYPTNSSTYSPIVFWGMHYGGTATDYTNYDYE